MVMVNGVKEDGDGRVGVVGLFLVSCFGVGV